MLTVCMRPAACRRREQCSEADGWTDVTSIRVRFSQLVQISEAIFNPSQCVCAGTTRSDHHNQLSCLEINKLVPLVPNGNGTMI
jgi:hypothetical protein